MGSILSPNIYSIFNIFYSNSMYFEGICGSVKFDKKYLRMEGDYTFQNLFHFIMDYFALLLNFITWPPHMETGSNLFITFPAFFRKGIIHFSHPDQCDMPVIKHLAPIISEYIIHSIIFFLHWCSYYCICLPMFRDFFNWLQLKSDLLRFGQLSFILLFTPHAIFGLQLLERSF